MHYQAAATGPVPVQLLVIRLRSHQCAPDDFLDGELPHDFPELASHRTAYQKPEELSGALVGEQNALIGIDGNHSLDHAAEDGAQLLAILLDLVELLGQAFAHRIEGAGQGADLVLAN